MTMLTDEKIKDIADKTLFNLLPADELVLFARAIEAELAAAQLDAPRYRWLREACGYVQDGSSTSVTISQDDASHEWVCRLVSCIHKPSVMVASV